VVTNLPPAVWDTVVGNSRLVAIAVVTAALAACRTTSPTRSSMPDWYLQANISGGWADGAEARGVDDVVTALADRVAHLTVPPRAIFLNEACESHGEQLAARLGGNWTAFFVQAWPGHSDCFPAEGQTEGRYGNAVLVSDPAATRSVIPSCNDPVGVVGGGCIPNWQPPAEQRRGVCAATGNDLLCSVHLDPRHWARHAEQLAAIGRIASVLADGHRAVVIGGDLNDGMRETHHAFRTRGDVRFVDLVGSSPIPTYPAAGPTRDLDHILYGTSAPARSAGTRTIDLGSCVATFHEDGRCTDHLALLVAVVVG
jgi:endonuclease/exonuclease/phosphatase family metal-dependent hydrolase